MSLRVTVDGRELSLERVLVVTKTSRYEYEKYSHPELTDAQLAEVRGAARPVEWCPYALSSVVWSPICGSDSQPLCDRCSGADLGRVFDKTVRDLGL